MYALTVLKDLAVEMYQKRFIEMEQLIASKFDQHSANKREGETLKQAKLRVDT